MSLLYDLILEMKLSLSDDMAVEIVTVNNENDTTIRATDKLNCFDGLLIVHRRNGRQCIINLEYVVKVYTRRKDL